MSRVSTVCSSRWPLGSSTATRTVRRLTVAPASKVHSSGRRSTEQADTPSTRNSAVVKAVSGGSSRAARVLTPVRYALSDGSTMTTVGGGDCVETPMTSSAVRAPITGTLDIVVEPDKCDLERQRPNLMQSPGARLWLLIRCPLRNVPFVLDRSSTLIAAAPTTIAACSRETSTSSRLTAAPGDRPTIDRPSGNAIVRPPPISLTPHSFAWGWAAMVVGSREAVGIPDETRAATAGGTLLNAQPTHPVRAGGNGQWRVPTFRGHRQTPELVGGL